MDGSNAKQAAAPQPAPDAKTALPAGSGPPAPEQDGRRRQDAEPSFGRALARVLLVQLAALGVLWALQAAYHR